MRATRRRMMPRVRSRSRNEPSSRHPRRRILSIGGVREYRRRTCRGPDAVSTMKFPTLRRLLAAACLALGAVVWDGGCRDNVGPPAPFAPPPPPPPGAIVSDPLPPASPAAPRGAFSVSGASGSGITYVSLTPGTAPGGLVAQIRNTRTGDTLSVPVGARAFDPV